MLKISRRRAPVLGALLLGGGCATTRPTATPTTPTTAAPTCAPRSRVLAGAARATGAATLRAIEAGYALAWSERVGEREALRFLLVDKAGAPRSPSVEIVDRGAHLVAPAIATEGEVYAVSWAEGQERLQRTVDGRGRPHSDVGPAAATVEPAAPTRCVPQGDKLHCASDGHGLELPAGARPLAEANGAGLALIAQDGEGLRLWVLDCGTH